MSNLNLISLIASIGQFWYEYFRCTNQFAELYSRKKLFFSDKHNFLFALFLKIAPKLTTKKYKLVHWVTKFTEFLYSSVKPQRPTQNILNLIFFIKRYRLASENTTKLSTWNQDVFGASSLDITHLKVKFKIITLAHNV